MDEKKLIDRLENELGWGIGPAMLCQEAATAIKRLAAERDAAKVQAQQADRWERFAHQVGDERARALARNEILSEALQSAASARDALMETVRLLLNRVTSNERALRDAEKALQQAVEHYAARTISGGIVAADEQYKWVADMMKAAHRARAALEPHGIDISAPSGEMADPNTHGGPDADAAKPEA